MSKEAAKLHESAADHYAQAAAAHLKAADAYRAGDIGQAAAHALRADAQAAYAEEAKLDAYKEHDDEYGEPAPTDELDDA